MKFGRFELREKLGAGAFGTVYRAWDEEVGREVALKVVPIDNDADAARLRREPKAAGKLVHPHIVPVFRTGVVDGNLYIASALIQGTTLQEWIARRRAAIASGTCDYRKTAALVRKIADALTHAHERGVVHRDVKPGNILIDDKGEPFLTDFGLARVHDAASQSTAEGIVKGTAAYMSPEQAAGDNSQVGPASDQFSLGVVLYELLCGEPPFQGPPMAVLYQIRHESPGSLQDRQASIPPALISICETAMAKSPGARFASLAAMSRALAEFAQRKHVPAPVAAPPRGSAVPPPAPVAKAVPKAQPSAPETAIGPLTTIASGSASPTVRRARRRSDNTPWLIGGIGVGVLILVGALGLAMSQLSSEPDKPVVVNEDAPHNAGPALPRPNPDGREDRAVQPPAPPQDPTTDDKTGTETLPQPGDGVVPSKPPEPNEDADPPPESVDVAPHVLADRRALAINSAGAIAAFTDEETTTVRLKSYGAEIADSLPGETIEGRTWAMAFSEKTGELATGGEEGVLRLWRLVGSKPTMRQAAEKIDGEIFSVAFDLFGRPIAGDSQGRLLRWNPREMSRPEIIASGQGAVLALAVAPDGKTLISAHETGEVVRWSVKPDAIAEPQLLPQIDIVAKSPIHTLAYSPDGRRVAAGGEDGVIRQWETAVWEQRGVLRGTDSPVTGLACSPLDDRMLFSSSADGVRMWDARYEDEWTSLTDAAPVHGIVLDEAGNRLTVFSNEVVQWELRPDFGGTALQLRSRLRTWTHPKEHELEGVVFSPDGKTAVATSIKHEGKKELAGHVFQVATGEWKYSPVIRESVGPRYVSFHPTIRHLLVGGANDYRLYLWKPNNTAAQPIQSVAGNKHGLDVMCARFSPDGKFLISASRDATVRIWEYGAFCGGVPQTPDPQV